MTTRILIYNDASSNGDVHMRAFQSCEGHLHEVIHPGDTRELWITTETRLALEETWPTAKPYVEPKSEEAEDANVGC